jgi:4a-hydroxytetrahydrobiopterin dehydratase
MSALFDRHCSSSNADSRPLDKEAIETLMAQIERWEMVGNTIRKRFDFADYHQTMAFVNAIAWIAHKEDHHPQLTVGYNSCMVEYSTHAAGGLTENDFICASKVDFLSGTSV